MKEIYLDPNDDLMAVQKKIEGSDSNDLSVFVPRDSIVARVRNLKLILREAHRLNKKVTFVSDDPAVRTMIATMHSEPAPRGDQGFVIGQDVAARAAPITRQRSVSLDKKENGFTNGWKRIVLFFKSKGFVIIGTSAIGAVLLILGLIVVYSKIHKAVITFTLKEESVNKSFEVSASPNVTQIDFQAQKIPAQITEATESASESTPATGKQMVGEKAKGTVTISNLTNESKTFEKGTRISLINTQGKKATFFLDSSITIDKQKTVPSNQLGVPPTIEATKVDVEVVAENIGEEYNLDKGQFFSISNLSTNDFVAQNASAFKGGSKREVVVVTTDDLNKVTAALTEKLTAKVRKSLLDNAAKANIKANENTITTSIQAQSFDKKLGDTADEVTLTMRMIATAYTYNEDDLKKLIAELMKGSVPDRLRLLDAKEISTENSKVVNGELVFLAKVSDKVVTKIEEDKVKKDIAGKRMDVVQTYLSALQAVESFKVEVTPTIPFKLQRMPGDISKITVKFETHGAQ